MEILTLIKRGKITGVHAIGNIVSFDIQGSSAPYIVECKSMYNAELIADKYSDLLIA